MDVLAGRLRSRMASVSAWWVTTRRYLAARTAAEAAVLARYAGGYVSDTNTDSAFTAAVRELVAAGPAVPTALTLYRGLKPFSAKNSVQNWKVGDVVENSRPVSTSLRLDVALGFAIGHGRDQLYYMGPDVPIYVLILSCPAGRKGLLIGDPSWTRFFKNATLTPDNKQRAMRAFSLESRSQEYECLLYPYDFRVTRVETKRLSADSAHFANLKRDTSAQATRDRLSQVPINVNFVYCDVLETSHYNNAKPQIHQLSTRR